MIYEYECEGCCKTWEVMTSNYDAEYDTCPGCGEPCKRFISETSFRLRGSGWYNRPDYPSVDVNPDNYKEKRGI